MKQIATRFPAAMLTQMDAIAAIEGRTRMDLIRESVRMYMAHFNAHKLPVTAKPQPVSAALTEAIERQEIEA